VTRIPARALPVLLRALSALGVVSAMSALAACGSGATTRVALDQPPTGQSSAAPSPMPTVPDSASAPGEVGATASVGHASSGPGTFVQASPGASPATLPRACREGDVRVAVLTDRADYAPELVVAITVTLRNTSAARCSAPGRGPGAPDVRALSSAGQEVWHSGCGSADGAQRPCPLYASQLVVLAPGETRRFTTTWEQRASSDTSDPGPRVPRGSYLLRSTLVGVGESTIHLGG
jgi:hypothetical protein